MGANLIKEIKLSILLLAYIRYPKRFYDTLQLLFISLGFNVTFLFRLYFYCCHYYRCCYNGFLSL